MELRAEDVKNIRSIEFCKDILRKLCRSEWAAAIFIPEKCLGEKHAERYMRWEKRWLKLAEQFKEGR